MRKLGKWCFRHRLITVLAWVGTLVALTAIHSAAGSAYSDNFDLSGTQSFDAVNLLRRSAPKASGDTDQIVIAVEQRQGHRSGGALPGRVDARERREAAARIGGLLALRPRRRRPDLSSGQVAFANVQFDVQANKITAAAAKEFVNTARAGAGNGVKVEVEGQVAQAANQNGAGGLPFGFLAAGVVLFLVFGSLLAMALPLLTAGLALGTGIAVIGLLSHAIQMASFSSELSLLIGLGVGVDYALFIVTRYRQGLLRGLTARRPSSSPSTPPVARCCSPG